MLPFQPEFDSVVVQGIHTKTQSSIAGLAGGEFRYFGAGLFASSYVPLVTGVERSSDRSVLWKGGFRLRL